MNSNLKMPTHMLNHPFYPKLNIKNSVSICLRQNRFLEGKNKKKDTNNYFKSENFNLEQISYINQCIDFLYQN